MLRNILVAFFLIGSACAMHLEYLKVDTEEHLDGTLISATSNGPLDQEKDLPMPEEEIPGVCSICEKVIKKVKSHLGKHENVEKIKDKLRRACDAIKVFKDSCKKIVNQYIDILVAEISTSDDPKTICAKAGFCKSVGMLELIQAFPESYQKL